MATGKSGPVRMVQLSEVGPQYQPTFESAAGDDSKVEDGIDDSRRQQNYNGGGKTRSTMFNICNSDKDFDFSVFQQKRSDSWCQTGVSVGTRNLSYSVLKAPKLPCFGGREPVRKQLLKDITLVVNPGEVTYVMGPSGAGKSTFLDTLAGRLKSGIMSGEVYFNGRPRSADFFDNSAYVRQDDIHIATLTVRETLRYAARLRIGTDYTVQEREERVAAVAELLDLGTCMDCIVGDGALKGISGGQMKRLSIAVEILHMPSLIFLDEPTSGLDSVMSFEVMSFARKLSQQKRTILATIHQPSSETLMLSSKVIVMVAGRLAYCGPTEEIVTYFSSPQLRFPTDQYHNPAEYMLAVVSGLIESPIIGHAGDDPDKLSAAFRDSAYFEAPSMFKGQSQLAVSRPARFPTSITGQTLTLLERFWITQIRDTTTVLLTIATRVGVALVFGAIFLGVGKVPAQRTFSPSSFNLASLMYLATFYVVACVVQIMPQISSYKVLYTREREANAYSTVAYWLTHCVVALPVLLVAHVAWLEIIWWMIGLPRNPGVHLFILFVLFVTHVCGWYMAQLISAVTPDATLALCLFPLVFVFMVAFSGFAIPFDMMPKGLVWITYLVFTRWCYEAVTMTIFSVRLDYKPVIDFFALGQYPRWTCVGILCGFLVGIAVAVYFALCPKRSKLVIEQEVHVDNASGTKPEPSGSHVAVPVMFQTQTTYTVKDFRAKSVNRIPGTPGKTLLFKDLEYSVGRPPKVKPLLKGISGCVEAGEMCALMGGSGAGKSTLLDVLAFRKTGGYTRGEYFIGGKAERPAGKWYSYVMQDNVHISVFTVRETLRFAAQLRLEEGVSTEKRNKRAENVMTMLGLEHVADVLVGDAWIKGISGGQARRLTIGVEIMQLPDVIFLDEPTTGLDSTTSYEVMAAVRNIADHRRTVVCTIHSPSESVFNLFDKLILLAAGRQTYYGDADAAVNYFTQPYFGWQMAVNKNPSDFVMLASEGMLGADGGKRMTIRDLSEAFMKQNSYREVSDAVALLKVESNSTKNGGSGSGNAGGVSTGGGGVASVFSPNNPVFSKGGAGNRMFARQDRGFIDHFEPVGARSLLSQMRILAWRQLCRLSKMRIVIGANIVKSIIVGLFHGVVYMHLAPDGIMQRLSLLFFAMMYTVLACMTFIPEIFADRLLYYRERGSSVYGAFPYWLSSSIPFLPMTIVSTWAYAQIMYYMCRLHPGAENFGYFLLILMLDSLFGLYFCQFISFMMPSPDLGVTIYPSTVFIFVAFCGFVVSLNSLPHWLKWATDASFARWSYQGLFVNEFYGNHDLIFKLPGFPTLKYADWVYAGFAGQFGFDASIDKWKSVWVLLINVGAVWLVSYIPFRFVSFEKR